MEIGKLIYNMRGSKIDRHVYLTSKFGIHYLSFNDRFANLLREKLPTYHPHSYRVNVTIKDIDNKNIKFKYNFVNFHTAQEFRFDLLDKLKSFITEEDITFKLVLDFKKNELVKPKLQLPI